MSEVIYVLTNEAMPELVKIGCSRDSVEGRIRDLSAASGVPLPFECYFAAEVKNCADVEKKLHQLFADSRINPKREFFKIDPEKVVLAISIGDFREVTPGGAEVDQEEQQALDKARARRPRIRLEALGIRPGAILTFSRDESVTAQVIAGGKVLYRGEPMSLSYAAVQVLRSLGYQTPSASGSEYWMFEGELLDERRRRMEAEQFDASPTSSTADELGAVATPAELGAVANLT